MKLSTQPYKGTRDFYPEDKRLQKYMFGVLRQVVESYGYHEYDASILEPVDIYAAKSGEEIVNEQLYSFEDKGGRKVAIRPEMTPTVSRMVAARRQELAYPLRLYSIPNLWRYERPQRGRLREHWQLNVDIFGIAGIEADHEIILIADSILKTLGAKSGSYTIYVNSRELLDYFLSEVISLNQKDLQAVSRLIDKKSKISATAFVDSVKKIIRNKNHVAQLVEFLNSKNLSSLPSSVRARESVTRLEKLLGLLRKSGVNEAAFNPSTVRGLDYYTDIVFEVYDNNPDNNRSMFGGGRYDGLVGLFGVAPLPTVGFGMGDVTLQNFLEGHKLLPKLPPEHDAVVILIGDVYAGTQSLLKELRAKGANLSVDNTGRKLDTQIKNAVKSDARYAIFIGEEELKSGKLKLRDLGAGQEKVLTLSQLAETLTANR